MLKKRLLTVLAVSALLSMSSKIAFADTTDSNTDASVANTEQLIQKMTAQTNALESQMSQLKKQIRQLKAQQQQLTQQQQQTQASVASIRSNALSPVPVANKVNTTTSTSAPYLPSLSYIPGTPIVIAPYIGDHTAFNASDLIVNYSSYNEDLNLATLRQNLYDDYAQENIQAPNYPVLMLSGKVEGQAIYSKPYDGGHTSRFDLSGVELDIIPILNQWANGLIAIKYDNSQVPNTPLTSNSRTYVDRGFLTLGNLDQFPLYVTLGQFYVPFGTYSSNMISSPITQLLFQTRARALLLGYQSKDGQGLYAQAFGFNGDTSTNHTDNINNLGANAGWDFRNNQWNMDVGVGGIANVADSLGMQTTDADEGSFAGFSESTLTNPNPEILHRQVPGLAVHANFGVGNFGVNSEYITATSSFAAQDMLFDNSPAKPQALNIETFYNFPVYGKPSAITIGYGSSWEALALNVPQRRYIAAFTTSFWKDTIQELEFRHDVNYGMGDNATVQSVAIPASAKSGSSNTATLQLGVYF